MRSEEEGRTQLEITQRQVADHKKEGDAARAELRKTTNQVR